MTINSMTLFLLQTNKNQRCKYIAICLLVQFLFLGIQKMVNNWNENRFEICKLEITTTTKSLQSCPTLCDPADGSPPGSTIPGSLQARTLEWVSISFSNAWKWKVKVICIESSYFPKGWIKFYLYVVKNHSIRVIFSKFINEKNIFLF